MFYNFERFKKIVSRRDFTFMLNDWEKTLLNEPIQLRKVSP